MNNVSKCPGDAGKSGAQIGLEGNRNEGESKPTPGGRKKRKKAKRKKNVQVYLLSPTNPQGFVTQENPKVKHKSKSDQEP